MIKFKVGETYDCVALYGDFLFIKIIDRTENKIRFVYLDDDEIHEKEIQTQTCTVYGKELEVLGNIDTEVAVAWEYHSKYAMPNEVDYGYWCAFDNDKLYNKEEFANLKKGE